MIKIKNKTELRKELLEAKGTSLEWDSIEFYSDGDWERRNHSTYSTGAVARYSVASLIAPTVDLCDLTTSKIITNNFKEIEKFLNE